MPVEVSAEHGVRVTTPDGWQRGAAANPAVVLAVVRPDRPDEFQPNVQLVRHPRTPLTPEEYVTLSRLEAKRLSGRADLAADGPPAAGTAAWVLEYETDRLAGRSLRFRQHVHFLGDDAFVLTATAPPQAFERLRAEIEVVLSSFERA
jgi:hypothetical protein